MNSINKNITYHLLPADMEYFSIRDIEREMSKGQLKWSNGHADGTHSQEFNKDDVVYIYYKNLPDGTRRILFRGIVRVVSDIPEMFSDGNKYKYFTIVDIETINLENNKNIDVSLTSLKENYGVNINRSMQYLGTEKELKDYINNKDNYDSNNAKRKIKLIYDLENNIDRYRTPIKTSITYFNNYDFCECCKILGYSSSKCKLRTFKKENGFTYYEVHHLIMRSSIKKDMPSFLAKLTKKNIDMEFNRINLCPVCHREFHYGTFGSFELKKHIVEELMLKHNFEEELKKLEIPECDIKRIKEYTIAQYIQKNSN